MKLRIPLTSSLDPEVFGGGSITSGTDARNIIYEKYSDGKLYGTQRPPIAVVTDASAASVNIRGRGCYFWEATNALYFINNNTIYKGNYATTIGTITAGIEPVTMLELGSRIVIIDHENNRGWTITTGGTLTQITDSDFPTDLIQGAAVLDGYLFVGSSDGTISQSVHNNPTSWVALDFLTAEREPDKAVHITKYLDQVVVFGSRTIEFFYNAGYPAGSVLQRRNDISFKTGVTDGRSIHNTGDKIYFIGSDLTGSGSVYLLDSFQVSKISNPQIDRYIHDSFIQSDLDAITAGFSINGHELLLITALSTVDSNFQAVQTIVYDRTTKLWSLWDISLPGFSNFPLVKWTDQTSLGSRQGFGIFLNGDIFKFSGSSTPTDVVSESDTDYMVDLYIQQQDDYVLALGADAQANIECRITLAEFDGDVQNNKMMHKVELVGGRIGGTTGTTNVDIRWSDDHYNTFSATRSIDTNARRKLTRLGLFNRRAFELTYTGAEQLRFEALEIDFKGSNYA